MYFMAAILKIHNDRDAGNSANVNIVFRSRHVIPFHNCICSLIYHDTERTYIVNLTISSDIGKTPTTETFKMIHTTA